MVQLEQQNHNILLILHNDEKDLYQVYTIMEGKVSYLLVLLTYINSNQKNSEIKDYALFLGNVSKDFIINNMKKT